MYTLRRSALPTLTCVSHACCLQGVYQDWGLTEAHDSKITELVKELKESECCNEALLANADDRRAEMEASRLVQDPDAGAPEVTPFDPVITITKYSSSEDGVQKLPEPVTFKKSVIDNMGNIEKHVLAVQFSTSLLYELHKGAPAVRLEILLVAALTTHNDYM